MEMCISRAVRFGMVGLLMPVIVGVTAASAGKKKAPHVDERFVGEFRLPSGMVAVVAEGDREPRSIGSYSIRVYAVLPTGSFVAGMIRPRNGFIREVRVLGPSQPGRDEIAVVMETAGSGRYTTTDAFIFDGRDIVLRGKEAGRQPP
jgi:hypothetical protein